MGRFLLEPSVVRFPVQMELRHASPMMKHVRARVQAFLHDVWSIAIYGKDYLAPPEVLQWRSNSWGDDSSSSGGS